MKTRWAVLALALAPAFAWSPALAQGPLELREVLASARRHHPRVQAALARIDVAEAELMGARGSFDPRLSTVAKLRVGGYYDLRRIDVELRQPTPLWGTQVFAGYRYGRGVDSDARWPTYYSDQTLPRGEIRAGLSLPIWRNGPLDERRAGRRIAEDGIDVAERTRDDTWLSLQKQATEAYWSWVAAGRALAVTQSILDLARTRVGQVERRIQAGAVAPIEGLEARRALLTRQRALNSARRSLEASSLVLGLFYRDRGGDPLPPPPERLPSSVNGAPPDLEAPELAFRRVVGCHPMLQALRAKLRQVETKVSLARARRGPRLDAEVQVSRDLGEEDVNPTLGGTVLEAGLYFELPLLLRSDRGALDAAEAERDAVREELRLAEDQLRTAIADTVSANRMAQENLRLAQETLEVVSQLAEAERRRFDAGTSSLLIVNLREQSLAEAGVAEVEAAAGTWKAYAAWQALTTCDPVNRPVERRDQ